MANCVGGAPDTGDTAAMIFATTFVMLQTPAIGLTQAGFIRRKNALSMLMQTFTGMCIGSLLFFVFGFSLVFSRTKGKVIGDLDWAFMVEVPYDDCLPLAPTIPGILYAAFQMSFALMVPVIVTGSWVEKLNFKAFLIFIILWPILVYYPLAHWVWNPEGWLFEQGVLDFAGGITIHTSCGTAGLVVSLLLQRRKDFQLRGKARKKFHKWELGWASFLGQVFRHEPEGRIGHHNFPLAVIGATLIWVGWYSFNGGSALGGNAQATKALMNTHISACTGGLTWVLYAFFFDGKFHMSELINGAFAGLAGITPGSGFVDPPLAVPIGFITASMAFASAKILKKLLNVDDVLDVTSLQGTAGAVGSILVGFAAHNCSYCKYGDGIWYGDGGDLLGAQVLGVVISIAWTALWTGVIVLVMKYTPYVGIDITPEEEEQGLDACQIGEQAYDETLRLIDDLGSDAAATRLCDAASAGDLDEVKRLILVEHADPELGDHDGRRPAHLAAANGRLSVLQFLKRQNINLGIKDNFGNTPLDDAVENQRKDVVKFLRKEGLAMNEEKLRARLFYACSSGNREEVRKILSGGLNVDCADYDKRTPLMVAAADGQLAIVKYLIKTCNADLEARDRWDQTALQTAIMGNHVSVAAYIRDISKGVRRSEEGTREDQDGDEMIDILSNPKVQASVRELCAASAEGNLAEIKRLIVKGADPSMADYDSRTPLHLAAGGGHLHSVKFLLKKKVNINAIDRFHRTPLQEAIAHRRENVRAFLKSYGAVAINNEVAVELCALAARGDLEGLEELAKDPDMDFDVGDYDSRTPLHLAASEGHLQIVQWLLNKGVNPAAKDRYNHTARDDAQRYGYVEIVGILEQAESEAKETLDNLDTESDTDSMSFITREDD